MAVGRAGRREERALLASYVEARKLPAVWYHVDAGDGDPATFFYYLGLAAAGLGGKKLPALPLFTDEYRRDLEGFARRWFREFFARMPAGSVLVLDNTEALRVYRRCRELLSVVLGLQPSPETEAVRRSLDAPLPPDERQRAGGSRADESGSVS